MDVWDGLFGDSDGVYILAYLTARSCGIMQFGTALEVQSIKYTSPKFNLLATLFTNGAMMK